MLCERFLVEFDFAKVLFELNFRMMFTYDSWTKNIIFMVVSDHMTSRLENAVWW